MHPAEPLIKLALGQSKSRRTVTSEDEEEDGWRLLDDAALKRIRNRGKALGGGLGAVGAYTLLKDEPDKLTTLLGTLGGGAGGYLAARTALNRIFPERAMRKYAAGYVIRQLQEAKHHSDVGNYKAKHHRLAELIRKYPEDFWIDSREGTLVGLSHASGFRFHMPANKLPIKLREIALQPNEETVAATA